MIVERAEERAGRRAGNNVKVGSYRSILEFIAKLLSAIPSESSYAVYEDLIIALKPKTMYQLYSVALLALYGSRLIGIRSVKRIGSKVRGYKWFKRYRRVLKI